MPRQQSHECHRTIHMVVQDVAQEIQYRTVRKPPSINFAALLSRKKL